MYLSNKRKIYGCWIFPSKIDLSVHAQNQDVRCIIISQDQILQHEIRNKKCTFRMLSFKLIINGPHFQLALWRISLTSTTTLRAIRSHFDLLVHSFSTISTREESFDLVGYTPLIICYKIAFAWHMLNKRN